MFDFTGSKISVNEKNIADVKILFQPKNIKIEINGTFKNYKHEDVKNILYKNATIFGTKGNIYFEVDDLKFQKLFKDTKRNVVMYALYYNLIKINKKVKKQS